MVSETEGSEGERHKMEDQSVLALHVCSVALCRNRTLVTLELGRNALTDTSAQLLGDALKLNFKLEGLSLWQNEISGPGAQCIAEGLQVRTTLWNSCSG